MPPLTGSRQNFIPREQAFTPVASARDRKGIKDLFVLLSIVLFIASGAIAVGVFLYGEYLKNSSISKLDQLEHAKDAFEPQLIHELTRLDDRMRSAGDVLGAHIAPTALFDMLESATIGSIRYTSLEFDASDPAHMNIKMSGIAGSVNAIALQADLFAEGGMVASPIFSNINREPDGVHFQLSARVNPATINFAQLVALAASGAMIEQEPIEPAFEDTDPFMSPGVGGEGLESGEFGL